MVLLPGSLISCTASSIRLDTTLTCAVTARILAVSCSLEVRMVLLMSSILSVRPLTASKRESLVLVSSAEGRGTLMGSCWLSQWRMSRVWLIMSVSPPRPSCSWPSATEVWTSVALVRAASVLSRSMESLRSSMPSLSLSDASLSLSMPLLMSSAPSRPPTQSLMLPMMSSVMLPIPVRASEVLVRADASSGWSAAETALAALPTMPPIWVVMVEMVPMALAI